jgi:cell division protein ZapE
LNGLNRQLFLPFIDVLKSKFEILNLDHETDYRQEKIKHKDHYLCPLNHQTQTDFEKIWHILTDYNQGDVYRLEQAGRVIKFTKAYKNIVYSDFYNLCQNPLGVTDYTAIAEQFSILLLDNIPQLTPDMRNEATRFRNLIDVFYDKRLKIYFRANVPLRGLYLKGDYAFEFERTLSRIQEMQSKDYCPLSSKP